MTISSENNATRYTADGTQTQFTGTFKIYDQAHVKVLVDDSVQTLGTDYTVSGVGQDSGFTVTFTTAPPANSTVTLLLAPPSTQLTDYTSNDPFPAETHERALDLLTQQVLALKEKLGRLLGFSEKSTYKDITVDDPVAGRFLRWKSDLSGLENIDIAQQGLLSVSDYMKTVLDDQDAATARGTLGAAGKVSGATSGNFASLDANGDLLDSGKASSDFLASSEKGTANGVATLDASAQLVEPHSLGGVLGSIKRFTANGTWTKPAGLRFVVVVCVGGGAGGGTGRNSATPITGGPGGGAGGVAIVKIDAADLNSSETVVVGTGGAGASGGELLAGSAGGDSSFGSHVTSGGGQPGAVAGSGDQGGAGGTVTVAATAQPLYTAQGCAGGSPVKSGSVGQSGALGGAGYMGAGVGRPGGYSAAADDSAPNTGAGGSGSGSVTDTAGSGGSGVVIVYEYF